MLNALTLMTVLLYSNISLDTKIVSYNYLLIPHGLNGLSFILVILTIIEFILAQAPHDMQGFLIGIWYSLQSINVFILAIESVQKSTVGDIFFLLKQLL